ncbi:MAG: ROK family protein [Anaerolineales bacterium]
MIQNLQLIPPSVTPPLDADFRPISLTNFRFNQQVERNGSPLIIGLERNDAEISRFEMKIYPENHPDFSKNYQIVERTIKFLLWQRGGFRIYIGGCKPIADFIQKCYSPNGERAFDYHFMGEQVYERPFEVIPCDPHEVPLGHEDGKSIGQHLNGCRVGFDLGASDRKASAIIDGKVVYSEEIIWEPRKHSDLDYHYREIMAAIKNAAAKMPRLDAVGGSSAGIYINNRPMVASLFRGIPKNQADEVKNLFVRIQNELNVPLFVINDGDVTALAGSMSIGDNAILGIAMGSSEAAGYVNPNGNIMGWLNELAFAPIDYNPHAPIEEWSGDKGCGASYLSQQCIFRLAPKVGIALPPNITDAEKQKQPGAQKLGGTLRF